MVEETKSTEHMQTIDECIDSMLQKISNAGFSEGVRNKYGLTNAKLYIETSKGPLAVYAHIKEEEKITDIRFELTFEFEAIKKGSDEYRTLDLILYARNKEVKKFILQHAEIPLPYENFNIALSLEEIKTDHLMRQEVSYKGKDICNLINQISSAAEVIISSGYTPADGVMKRS